MSGWPRARVLAGGVGYWLLATRPVHDGAPDTMAPVRP